MKPSPDSNDEKWAQLAARARADQPPPLDVSAALRAARTEAAAIAAPRSWVGDFAALFATPRHLAGCGGFAAVAVVAATWFGLSIWSDLGPWADLLWSAMEGSV